MTKKSGPQFQLGIIYAANAIWLGGTEHRIDIEVNEHTIEVARALLWQGVEPELPDSAISALAALLGSAASPDPD